jgi:hypothetical protein
LSIFISEAHSTFGASTPFKGEPLTYGGVHGSQKWWSRNGSSHLFFPWRIKAASQPHPIFFQWRKMATIRLFANTPAGLILQFMAIHSISMHTTWQPPQFTEMAVAHSNGS